MYHNDQHRQCANERLSSLPDLIQNRASIPKLRRYAIFTSAQSEWGPSHSANLEPILLHCRLGMIERVRRRRLSRRSPAVVPMTPSRAFFVPMSRKRFQVGLSLTMFRSRISAHPQQLYGAVIPCGCRSRVLALFSCWFLGLRTPASDRVCPAFPPCFTDRREILPVCTPCDEDAKKTPRDDVEGVVSRVPTEDFGVSNYQKGKIEAPKSPT